MANIMQTVSAVFLFLCVTLFSLSSQANRLSKEELEQRLTSITIDEKARIPVLAQLVRVCWHNCPLDAEKYGAEALSLLDQYPNKQIEGEMLGYYQRVFLDRGDKETTEVLLKRGIAAAQEANDSKALANNLYNQAFHYSRSDKLVLALDTYYQLETTFLAAENMAALGSLYNNIANVEIKLGNWGKALELYQKALPLSKLHRNPANYANTLMNIGAVYHRQKDYSQALDNLKAGLAHLDTISAPLQKAEGNIRLGALYRGLAEFDLAMEHFEQAETISLQHKYIAPLYSTYLGMVNIGLKKGDIRLAEQSLTKLKEHQSDKLPDFYQTSVYFHEAKIAIANKNWLEAERLMQPVIDSGKFEQRYYDSLDVISNIIRIKEELGKFDEATELVKLVFEAYKTNVERNQQQQATQYAAIYKANEKERKIVELEEHAAQQKIEVLVNQQQKQWLIYSFSVVALALSTVLLLGYQRRRALQKEAALTKQLMQYKNQMLADITHELRAPFSVLKLQIEALQYNVESDTEKAHNRLHSKISQLTALIGDIDELAQADSLLLKLDKQACDMRSLVEMSCSDMEPALAKAQLEFEVQNTISTATFGVVDQKRVSQVITNLLGNSIRYTTAPGKVLLFASLESNQLHIRIEDTAPSVEEGELELIFDRLYSADNKVADNTGTGLGLSICRGLVELHQGKITAERSELGGIKILITIPV